GRDGVRASSAAERRKQRGVQPKRLRALEKLHVLGISARPTAFDKRDSDLIQGLRDLDLVLDRVGQPLALRAVAQRRVVNFYGFFHFSFSPCPQACSPRARASNREAARRPPRSDVSFRSRPVG